MKCDVCDATARDEAQENPSNVSLYRAATSGMNGTLGWAILTFKVMAKQKDYDENTSVASSVDLCPDCLSKMLDGGVLEKKVLREHSSDNVSHMIAHRGRLPSDFGGFGGPGTGL